MIRPTHWMAVTAVVAATTCWMSPAHAEDKNEIKSVTFDEDAGLTRVHVRGAQTPTFTVYKLEKPSRVVIDVPRARLAEALRGHEGATTLTANTWAVSSIAAQQLDDGGQLVRVIVSLARPGRYDVKTSGNEVIIVVTARDAAPETASPEQLAAAQAEASKAKAEAERLRKQAAESLARAEAAEKAAKNTQGSSSQELAKAKAAAEQARADATKAKQAAQAAQTDADQKRATAEQAIAKAEAGAAKAEADAAKARTEAKQAKQDLVKSRAEAEAAKAQAAQEAEAAAKTRTEAEAAKAKASKEADAAAKSLAEAQSAKTKALKEAEAAKQTAAQEANAARMAAQKEATAAKQAAAKEAETARQQAAKDAETARLDLERTKNEAAKAKREAEKAKAEAKAAQEAAAQQLALANEAKQEADRARREAETARTYAARQDDEVEAAKAEAHAAKTEAQQLREAAAEDKRAANEARKAAETARAQAETDRKEAVAARAEADKTSKEAKAQLATLDKKMAKAQTIEDKARAASAAAQAREEAAAEAVQKAAQERVAAEREMKKAGAASSAETKAAEQRLAQARKAAEQADQQRRDAEGAAQAAREQLAESRTTLATVEKQRAAAETAATTAARQRGEAEAAATDAARRRTEAETAAADAKKRKTDAEAAAKVASEQRGEAEAGKREAEAAKRNAEQQKKIAEDAARTAKAAAAAAEEQREVAEAAVKTAGEKRREAEASLASLTAKRQSAEKAAAELELRSKAEAKAQAEVAAAQTRKASEAELDKARAEAKRLADERVEAETQLAARRKEVAAQQAESAKLAQAAAQARDAATREETRRTELAEQRQIEEQELERVKKQRAVAVADAEQRQKKEEQELERVKKQRAVAVAEAAKPIVVAKPVVVQVPVPVPAKAQTPKPDARPVQGPAELAKITGIAFQGSGAKGQVDIAIAGAADVQLGEVTATHVELVVESAELADKLERKLDVSKFGSPVKAVSSFRDRKNPDRVRLIAELSRPATPTVTSDAKGIHWKFAGTEAPQVASTVTDNPSPVVGGFGAASTPIAQQSVSQVPPTTNNRRRVYRGATIDLSFKNAPIHDLLRLLSETGRVNIVIPESIDPKVTVNLKKVPWDQALEVILASQGLWYRREGNIYRVAPRAELDKEDEAEAARRAALVKAEVPRPEIVALNYASAADLKTKLEPMLSGAPGAALQVDERTNALIINDVAGNRRQIADLARALDTQTPQISIEARIVEARSTFLRQFGIQWGGRALSGATGGNATGLIFPSSISLVGGNEDAQTNNTGVANPSDFAVNLPAAVGSGEGGAIGLSLGSVGGNLNINLRLSALEDSGTVRIISAPKITVLNNKQARISQGVSIPISVISAAGTQTQFVQADLSLEVTPYVSSADCAIAMNLVVTKNEPDFVNVGARGDPTILRKEARTSMLVQDGETSVLGGIYTRNTGLAYKKIPFLADLPVIGWFFKSRRENDDRTEILVFITPKITNRSLLRCSSK